jgi:hypothetical protein
MCSCVVAAGPPWSAKGLSFASLAESCSLFSRDRTWLMRVEYDLSARVSCRSTRLVSHSQAVEGSSNVCAAVFRFEAAAFRTVGEARGASW